MLHSVETKDQQPVRTDEPPGGVANPRRTRLGADGRPIDAPADTGRD